MNIQCKTSGSFSKEIRALKMRSVVTSHWKLTMTKWEDHWSWFSYNYMRSCPSTQHQPFYGHSAFEANWRWKSLISACFMSWLRILKKIVVLKCRLLLSTQQQQTISRDCELWWKVNCIWQLVIAHSVVGWRKTSRTLPKAKLTPKQGTCHCLVICSWSDPL